MENSRDIIEWDGREWQRTGGKYYILRTDYKNRTGEMLHRAIWKKYNGEIPKGYDIHHKDHNPSNNDIDNLECISSSEHHKLHMQDPYRLEQSKKNLREKARPALRKWQKSKEGQERLKEMGKHMQEKSVQRLIETQCKECGTTFRMHPTRGTGLCRTCGKRANARKQEEKRKLERQANPKYIEVICTECGTTYRTQITTRNKDGLCKNCASRKRYRERKLSNGI